MSGLCDPIFSKLPFWMSFHAGLGATLSPALIGGGTYDRGIGGDPSDLVGYATGGAAPAPRLQRDRGRPSRYRRLHLLNDRGSRAALVVREPRLHRAVTTGPVRA